MSFLRQKQTSIDLAIFYLYESLQKKLQFNFYLYCYYYSLRVYSSVYGSKEDQKYFKALFYLRQNLIHRLRYHLSSLGRSNLSNADVIYPHLLYGHIVIFPQDSLYLGRSLFKTSYQLVVMVSLKGLVLRLSVKGALTLI